MGGKVMGLLFSLFSRGFFWGFWPQVAKTLRKPKWSKKYRLGDYIKPNISLKSIAKPRENQKLGDYMRPDISLKSVFIFFWFFFWFSRGFATFGQKSKKLEKTKKKKQQKKRLGDYMRPDISLKSLFFLFFRFFLFSQGFFGFWPKVAKTLRRPNTTKIRTPYEARHFPQIFGLSGVWKGGRNKSTESIRRSFRKPLKNPNFCPQLPTTTSMEAYEANGSNRALWKDKYDVVFPWNPWKGDVCKNSSNENV